MNFILILMFIYLFLKYKDLSEEIESYIVRLEEIEEILEVSEND